MSLQLWYIINFSILSQTKKHWKLVKILSSKENIFLNWGKYWGAPSDGELENSKQNKNFSCLQIADMSRISGSLTQAWLSVLTDKSSPEHT